MLIPMSNGLIYPRGVASTFVDVTVSMGTPTTFTPTQTIDILKGGCLNAAGTKMYLIAESGLGYQYTLSTAGDPSTASYDNKSFDFRSGSSPLRRIDDISISPDGTIIFTADSLYRGVGRFSLGTAEDISTSVYVDGIIPLGNIKGFWPKSDGTSYWLVNDTDNSIEQYDNTTPYTFSGVAEGTPDDTYIPNEVGLEGIAYSDAGDIMFTVGRNRWLEQYSLSAGYDLSSTVSSVGTYNPNTEGDTTAEEVTGIFVNSTLTDMLLFVDNAFGGAPEVLGYNFT